MSGNQKEYQIGATGLVNTREHLDAVGGGSYHICDFLQSSGAGSYTVRSKDVGDINVHKEVIIRGAYRFLLQVTGKMVKRSLDKSWRQKGAENVLKTSGTHDAST